MRQLFDAWACVCHNVVGRTGGEMPDTVRYVDLRLRMDIVPHADVDVVHALHEEEHALLGDLHDREVGARGRAGEEGGVEGAGARTGGTASWAVVKRAWAAPPSHNPTLPTAPFPTHNTCFTLGKSQPDKSQATSKASWGGGGGGRCVNFFGGLDPQNN